jgi:prepilin-type processing-associated H-X9-DG protein
LDRDTAARFVEGLLAGGMDKEAVNWMAQLDDAGPVKLLLRLQTGLLTPDAAVEQARAALAKRNAPPAYWDVMQFAATTQRNNLLRVEAMEHRLHLASPKSASVSAALAEDLWRTYALAAQELANQEKLLVGDDSAWSDFGARRAAASATAGRAIFAFLAMNSKVPATRANAQLQLVYSLQSSKLSMTALRLFADASRFQVKDIDTQARYLLGAMAAENNRQELADEIEGCADFWYPGIGTSDGMGCDNKGNAHSLTAQARSRHGGGVNACFADGHVQFVQDSISQTTWVQLQSIRDGQIPDQDY